METISNIASTATSTVSNLIYGNQDAATKTNETAGKEPVSGQTGKGTVDDPYDQGNSESALDKNTTTTTGTGLDTPTKVVEPTGSIQNSDDLIKAYNQEAGASSTSATTATGVTDKAGVTEKVWKPTDVDAVTPSVTDPTAAPETGVGAHGSSAGGKDTLWRGVDAYKDTSSSGTTTGPTSTGSTITGSEPTRFTSGESTTSGPKGDVDAEPKNYSVGDLTTGKETPPKPVGDSTTTSANTASQSDSKTGESAISPPDLSTTSPGDKPDYSADTHQPSPHSGGLVGERAGHGGPTTAVDADKHDGKKSSSISPSGGDDDEKSGKMDKLKDKLKTKLHIGSKDH
ncbi:hypothetical protein E8E13_010765 [Curvularia kusanoi]|uniref:Uncharacterized protein n=1 Tax=Curvularia kusanoi TaxID=90978 RepID=A0A9P4TLJ9_CURKU|nr:hypothetical protein E8E13_010765 [Curvularia kusanoi]